MEHAICQLSYFLRLLCLSQLWPASTASYLEDSYPASVVKDARSTTLQMLSKYKYPGEAHTVTTEDEYVLQMHRIPRPKAKPVLLMHGLQDSSASWIMMGPHSGLGYFLYDAGYDVWLGNARGNRYSRGHVQLNPKTERAYWNFSWHEIGIYDLPAMIDTVLNKTGHEKLTYFGHSQGTTSFFVLCSMRPEYNAKINVMQALAPVAYMAHMKTPLAGFTRSLFNIMGDYAEAFPHSYLYLNQCMLSEATMKACLYYVWNIIGKNTAELNMTMLPVILGHIPAGSSSKQFRHYLQLQLSDRFCAYDNNDRDDQDIHGHATPPEYALERVTAPVALYYGQNDYLSAVEDVQRLIKRLPNIVMNYRMSKNSNHIDVIWGIHARSLLQPRMLQIMQLLEEGGPQNGKKPLIEYSQKTSNESAEQMDEDSIDIQ